MLFSDFFKKRIKLKHELFNERKTSGMTNTQTDSIIVCSRLPDMICAIKLIVSVSKIANFYRDRYDL